VEVSVLPMERKVDVQIIEVPVERLVEVDKLVEVPVEIIRREGPREPPVEKHTAKLQPEVPPAVDHS
jgi:hypothetical protein